MSPDGVTWAESAEYNAASASLSLNVPADTWVLATVSVRSEAELSDGWTVLHVTQPVGAATNQRIVFGCIYAETAQTVSLTVTTQGSGRIYLTMMGFSFVGGFAYHPGTETVYTGSGPAVATRPAYPWLVWGCSAPFWRTNSTSDTWVCDELGTVIPDSGSYEKRQGNFLDFLSGSTRNFTTTSPSLSLPNGVVIDCVEVLPKEQGNNNDDSFLEGIAVGMSLVRDMQVSGFLTLQGNGPFYLSLNTVPSSGHYWDGALECSVNGSPWEEWDGRTAIQSGTDNAIRLRGTGNTRIAAENEIGRQWVITGLNSLRVSVDGNIENLLDWKTVRAGRHPEMGRYCFNSLFYGCTALVSAPELPATKLTVRCYDHMFYGCTSLTEAPALPATTLADQCYGTMFGGCTSLTKAPALPATELVSYCYAGMFGGCTSLTESPALPATELENYCYYGMLRRCTALTTAPELPATTMAVYCYSEMFYGCTSLTEAPKLPATNLSAYCYYDMFAYCDSLEDPPELPASKLARACYSEMFTGCTSLTKAPELPAAKLDQECYASMFSGCTGLVSPPEILATTLLYAPNCCASMFSGCTSLEHTPVLPATIISDGCYMSMFDGCKSLVSAPDLPAVHVGERSYYRMFRGCTGLTSPPKLPGITLGRSCYGEMFLDCKNLIKLPSLPATLLPTTCYVGMFSGCSGIKISTQNTGDYVNPYRIPTEGTGIDWGTGGQTNHMFDGTGGTFTGYPNINTTYYTSNEIVPAE